LTHQTATLDTAGTILALSLIDNEYAAPGRPLMTRTPGRNTSATNGLSGICGQPQ
jgi:hypothetical protein